jgi:hypothetical protein
MKNPRAEDDIDCIELKRRCQERLLDRTRGMTIDEEIAYFKRAAESGSLAELWRSLKQDSLSRESTGDAA